MNGQFDIGDFSPEKLFVGLSAILGLLFALVTESQASLLIHILHWQIQTSGAVLVVLSTHLVLFSNKSLLAKRPWLRVIISGFTGAILFSPIALLSDIYLGGEHLDNHFVHELLDEMFGIVPPITIAWLTINFPWLMGYRLNRPIETRRDSDNMPESVSIKKDQKGKINEPEFLSQTKIPSAKDILYIKSELHYLNVVTQDKKQLILYSLKEAISQLDAAGIYGIRCHRGYWVSDSAIKSAERVGRQAVLKLINGKEIPVSRTNVTQCLEKFA